jgi:hypothetical protein
MIEDVAFSIEPGDSPKVFVWVAVCPVIDDTQGIGCFEVVDEVFDEVRIRPSEAI